MIETREQLQEQIEKYEDMMAELQPLLWQRDELLKEIEEGIINLQEVVVTDNFIYECKTGNVTDHEQAARIANVPQSEIDKVTTITIKGTKDTFTPEYLELMKEAGREVAESIAWSKLKVHKSIKDSVTTDGISKMKISLKHL